MSAWILSIVGVICLGILLEIVLPDGQTSKYVKATFSLLVIFVIVSPLPKALGSSWKLDINDTMFQVDNKFIDETVEVKENSIKSDIEDYLALQGYTATVDIELQDKSLTKIVRINVIIKLSESEYAEKEKHILKVRQLIVDKCGISGDVIFVEANVSVRPTG
ncbi:MAG: stage III sporulation protein AF [Clostridia bacterium]